MASDNPAPEFWEAAFAEKQEMWGYEPAHSALIVRDRFLAHGVRDVLIPGIGYGRNASPFLESGMQVTGIEISKTAIALARQHFGDTMTLYHGSVGDMPFDTRLYDGIFCYSLIHLLDDAARHRLIADCWAQLAEGGLLAFTVVSKEAAHYGQGKQLGKDRYESFPGVQLFFYDLASIAEEFAGLGPYEVTSLQEHHPSYLVICQKGLELAR
jgi:SAM-dependent methyltransferase